MIQVDLSQTIIANCIVHNKELKVSSAEAKNFIKHMTFNTLLSYKKKYGRDYGNLLLACDSKSYWRKEYFPSYKGHRKHNRETDSINWELIFESISEIKSDLMEYFPYVLLEVDGAEADDIIASMTKYLQTNETTSIGLFDNEPQNILICSSDGDFVQLQKYKNVQQWSNLQKKMIKPKCSIHDYLIEHICTGDTGDGIPNILTPDQWSIDRMNNEKPIRQTPFKKTRLSKFLSLGKDACESDEEKRNWIRNQTLIDFDCIPQSIYNSIIDSYHKYKIKGNKMKLMNYFSKNKMKLLFAEINSF